MRRFFTIAVLMVAYPACSSIGLAKEPAENVYACSEMTSNLAFTECWQQQAQQSRSEVQQAFATIKAAARLSDRTEGQGREWLVPALEASQRDWLIYVAKQCEFEGKVARGGTGTRSLVAQCQTRLNNQRVAELKARTDAIEQLL